MKKKTTPRSLTLHRETLRSLAAAALDPVAGASISAGWSCANSGCDSQNTCITVCHRRCSIDICA